MSTFQPITPNWLSAAWDGFVQDDPEIEQAYDYPDYPSDMGGEGNWVDLFLTDTNDHPIGRLWLSPELETIGAQELRGSNTDYLTKIALELRELNYHGVNVLQAYDFIRNQYYADEQQTGDLADARVEVSAE